MKLKKALLVIIMLLLATSFSACQSDDELEYSDVRDYADPMSENMIIAFSDGDYEGFIKDGSQAMIDQLSQETFESQIAPLTDLIGQYQEDSKDFVAAKVEDKNFIQVVYNGEFSDEEGNVIITVVFNRDENDRKIEGFFINSPKLQDM